MSYFFSYPEVLLAILDGRLPVSVVDLLGSCAFCGPLLVDAVIVVARRIMDGSPT